MSTPSAQRPGDDPGYGATDFGQPAGAPTPAGANLAGFWIRFGAAIIDGILLSVVAGVLGAILAMNDLQGRSWLAQLLAAVYFTYLHGSTGQSLGQKVLNLKVVDEAGAGQIDYLRAFIRWLVSLVSGVAIGIGYLWMLWDSKNQTWHDKAARTLVVRV